VESIIVLSAIKTNSGLKNLSFNHNAILAPLLREPTTKNIVLFL